MSKSKMIVRTKFIVVSDHQESGALQAIQFPKQLEDAVGVTRVKVTGRFIRQYQARVIHQRTGNRHTLAPRSSMLIASTFCRSDHHANRYYARRRSPMHWFRVGFESHPSAPVICRNHRHLE